MIELVSITKDSKKRHSNIRNTIGYIFFICAILASYAQNPKLVIPPYTVDVSNQTLVSSNLPTSTSSIISGDGIFDNSGNLLFYIEDTTIYNAVGNQIGVTAPSTNFSSHNTQIIPVPSSCNKYYVVGAGDNGNLYYSTVQIDTQTNQATVIPTQNHINLNFAVNGHCAMATSQLNTNNERYLYIANNRISGGIHKFIVSASAITFSSSFFNPTNPLSQYYADDGGELELSQDGKKLATNRRNDVYVFNLNATGDYTSHTIYNIPNTLNFIGFEFVKNDTELWTSSGNPAFPSVNDGINIIDLNAPSSSTTYTHLPTTSQYFKTFIETINNGNILIRNLSNLVQVDVNTRVLTNSISIPANTNSGFGTYGLPNQLDYESNIYSGSTAQAVASFVNPDRIIQMNSKYGPGDVAVLCLTSDLLVDGSQSTCEDGYFVELNEFDLNTWTSVGTTNPLFSGWVSATSPAPNNIRITDFLPLGYQLRPNIVYKFRLAVGIPWHATDIFFMIDCCSTKPAKHKVIDKRVKPKN